MGESNEERWGLEGCCKEKGLWSSLPRLKTGAQCITEAILRRPTVYVLCNDGISTEDQLAMTLKTRKFPGSVTRIERWRRS